MCKATTEDVIQSLRALAGCAGHHPGDSGLILAAAQRLEIATRNVTVLLQQRERAIRALMMQEGVEGPPSCPFDMAYLDDRAGNPRDAVGFDCPHRCFVGECPYAGTDGGASEDRVYQCWLAWFERRGIG